VDLLDGLYISRRRRQLLRETGESKSAPLRSTVRPETCQSDQWHVCRWCIDHITIKYPAGLLVSGQIDESFESVALGDFWGDF
jgi:hypothetical protein